MLSSIMSNSTSLSEEASVSSVTRVQDFSSLNLMFSPLSTQQQLKIKKKRSLPGNPDPDAEVIALSPKALMATNRFICEICNKGFQRDQNLQLHRRGHNLPWKLRQRSSTDIRKKVYVCPEPTCIHHNPSRALGDLTGIKKHFCRKHGEKKWKCEKCSKRYAVQSDWKAHSKTCGTKEYRCDCGTLFSRKDSFITHRAFCDALAEETAKFSNFSPPPPTATQAATATMLPTENSLYLHPQNPPPFLFSYPHPPPQISWDPLPTPDSFFHNQPQKNFLSTPTFPQQNPHSTINTPIAIGSHLSATALLQKAANVGVSAISSATQGQTVGHMASTVMNQLSEFGSVSPMGGTRISQGCLRPNSGHFTMWQKSDHLTRDFLGLAGECGTSGESAHVRDLLSFTRSVDFASYDRDRSLLRPPDFGFADPAEETWGDC